LAFVVEASACAGVEAKDLFLNVEEK